jgi:putative effector of murein hydrolase
MLLLDLCYPLYFSLRQVYRRCFKIVKIKSVGVTLAAGIAIQSGTLLRQLKRVGAASRPKIAVGDGKSPSVSMQSGVSIYQFWLVAFLKVHTRMPLFHPHFFSFETLPLSWLDLFRPPG